MERGISEFESNKNKALLEYSLFKTVQIVIVITNASYVHFFLSSWVFVFNFFFISSN